MTLDQLAALQQFQQQLMDKSDELHAEARKMKHFASQEYCDGKARGLQFSAQELSALLGRIREEDYEGRSPDGDGLPIVKGLGDERALSPLARDVGSASAISPQQDHVHARGGADRNAAASLKPAAGSEPADLHTTSAPPLGADAPTDEHDPLCSIGTQAGDQTMPCDCKPPVNDCVDCVLAADALDAFLNMGYCPHGYDRDELRLIASRIRLFLRPDLPSSVSAKSDWLTTSDPRVVAVMGSVPECAANGCQFRKTSGYRPGEKADFPMIYPDVDRDEHAHGCFTIQGVVGCSCGLIQRRQWRDYLLAEQEKAGKAPTPIPSPAAPQAPAGWQPIAVASKKNGKPIVGFIPESKRAQTLWWDVKNDRWSDADGFTRYPSLWCPLPPPASETP